ncbi:hypothetical protein [Flavobacterium sp.]|jgi:hypothetical protein|uniref:hypothetical protein n=1 Tax=Flavobacterium sp. TaxID=239 RepID=UPI000EB8E4DF|nr:hypothetical protein [Flavobacterium sp.]HCQ13539.1 hypothetical protein [Flavobacterium sp.]
MDANALGELKIKYQEVIDLIAQKKPMEAAMKLSEVTEKVNDLIDYATSDKELQALSPFQILSNHLQLKIDLLKLPLN